MKTKEKIYKAQMTVLLFIIFPIMTGMSSCQKDKTLDLDITQFQWVLKSVSINSNTYKSPSGNFHQSDAYILKFENDSIFSLPTNTNTLVGKYKISSKGEIIIYGTSGTQIAEGEHTDFNNNLRSALDKTNTYSIKGKTLYFTGSNSEIEFKKK